MNSKPYSMLFCLIAALLTQAGSASPHLGQIGGYLPLYCQSSAFFSSLTICALNGPEVAVHRPQVRRNISNWMGTYRG
jgi:hypothetical protein